MKRESTKISKKKFAHRLNYGKTSIAGKTEEEIRKIIPWILEQRAGFANDGEILLELQYQGFSKKEACDALDLVKITYETLSPEYQKELLAQIKLSARTTAKQIESMYAAAETQADKAMCINMRMKNAELVRKLLPSQIEIQGARDNINDTLFQMFGAVIESADPEQSDREEKE